jgi:hypothetical protein
MVTAKTKYPLRVANPRAADTPAGVWPPSGHIVMTPQQPSNYCPFSVCLIMATTNCRLDTILDSFGFFWKFGDYFGDWILDVLLDIGFWILLDF